MIHTHQTAPTQFVEANGIRFAYRRFGKASGVPIVLNQHYTGTMDYWDPAKSAEDAVKAEIFFSMWALGGHDSALRAAQLTGGREGAPVPAEGLPAGCRS